jgi:hypothetical protein
MRHKDVVYIQKLLGVVAEYYDMLGYPDSWLWTLAQVAVRNYNWHLAIEAQRAFEYERTFYGWEAAMHSDIAALLKGEPTDWLSEEYAEGVEFFELQEELQEGEEAEAIL